MKKAVALTALTVALLVAAITVIEFNPFAALLYPADFEEHEDAYRKLVQLTLECCSDGDHMARLQYLKRRDPERAALMRELGVGVVHYYPGNSQHSGGIVYLDGDEHLFSGMYVYSVTGRVPAITDCYRSTRIRGKKKWYRSHGLFCLWQ
jgi:hypothetical protein